MATRKRARKPAPTPDITVEVGITRGDVALSAHVPAAHAEEVATWLLVLVRRITATHPDSLPTVDVVGGTVISDPWEDAAEQRRVGFTAYPSKR